MMYVTSEAREISVGTKASAETSRRVGMSSVNVARLIYGLECKVQSADGPGNLARTLINL